jgi:hypothetical protein
MFIIVIVLMISLLGLPTVVSSDLYQKGEIILKLNNSYLLYSNQTMPYVDKNNRTLIPLRLIGDLMQATTKWDGTKKEAIVSFGEDTIIFPIGKKHYFVNGTKKVIDTATVVTEKSTMIPLRFLAEEFDVDINFDNKNKVIHLVHPDLLNLPSLSRIDEMENVNNQLDGQLIPRNVEFITGKLSEDNYINISVLNISNQTITKNTFHRNGYYFINANQSGGESSFGYTAPSGGGSMTGYNEEDIPTGAIFNDKFYLNTLEHSPFSDDPIKYLLFNYFSTDHSENE